MTSDPYTPPRFLTETEVAEMTGISISKLRQDRYRSKGIPYSKVGCSVRYLLSDVLDFMAAHKVIPGRGESR